MTDLCFGFVGLGLIGGSIAKAIKKNIENCKIIAFDNNISSLKTATAEKIVDIACDSIDDTFKMCDYIFLCTPVSCNNNYLQALKDVHNDKCIITDVGSVKSPIHKEVHDLNLDACFIGGHPMAGSEQSGYNASLASILENAYYIITPTKKMSSNQITAFVNIVQKLGAIPLVLDEEKHDYMVAGISHLPHVIAFSLVNLIKKCDDKEGMMKKIAAGGFKDITRIASSPPDMWQQIFDLNENDILDFINEFIAQLSELKNKIKAKDSNYLYDFIKSAQEYRDSFESADFGPIDRSYIVSVFIPDETGMIAEISTLFAQEYISIKNIGIIHNRESGDGSLRIEFYDKPSLLNAITVLKTKKYKLLTLSGE